MTPLTLRAPSRFVVTDTWADRWVVSDWKADEGLRGEFVLSAGKWFGDAVEDLGIQTSGDARFYAASADFGKTISNAGKTLVVQFSVKHEQKLDCGGGYIKLLASTTDQKTFGGDTPYAVMFGPDICGSATKRTHLILTDKKGNNLLTKKTIPCETDTLTHIYTLVVNPNNTYSVLIDNAEKETGLLEEHFDFLLPKTVTDPAARKPLDWDDRREVPDVTDVKPEGHDDVPEAVTDPDARKPEGWHDDDDGEWEAPLVKNPLFKGPWVQKQIDNPNFAGTWTAPEIPNPAYVPNADLYLFHDLRYVGFELWQVTAGSIFDNVLVTDDAQYAFAAADAFLENSKHAETKMFELATAKQKTENEAEAKRLQEEAETNAAAENTFGDYEHSAEDEPGKDEL